VLGRDAALAAAAARGRALLLEPAKNLLHLSSAPLPPGAAGQIGRR
jgi:hypothetical protein